jgi:hypothetical protein
MQLYKGTDWTDVVIMTSIHLPHSACPYIELSARSAMCFNARLHARTFNTLFVPHAVLGYVTTITPLHVTLQSPAQAGYASLLTQFDVIKWRVERRKMVLSHDLLS